MDKRQKIVALILGVVVILLAPVLVWALVIAGLIQVYGGGIILAVLVPLVVCITVAVLLIRAFRKQ